MSNRDLTDVMLEIIAWALLTLTVVSLVGAVAFGFWWGRSP